jgi:hypothetical protein
MWAPHVFITYDYYEYSYRMSTIIYRYPFHMHPAAKLIIQSMQGLIMYACSFGMIAALKLVIRMMHQLIMYACSLTMSDTFKLIVYACSFDMSAYASVLNSHEVRGPNNY